MVRCSVAKSIWALGANPPFVTPFPFIAAASAASWGFMPTPVRADAVKAGFWVAAIANGAPYACSVGVDAMAAAGVSP